MIDDDVKFDAGASFVVGRLRIDQGPFGDF